MRTDKTTAFFVAGNAIINSVCAVPDKNLTSINFVIPLEKFEAIKIAQSSSKAGVDIRSVTSGEYDTESKPKIPASDFVTKETKTAVTEDQVPTDIDLASFTSHLFNSIASSLLVDSLLLPPIKEYSHEWDNQDSLKSLKAMDEEIMNTLLAQGPFPQVTKTCFQLPTPLGSRVVFSIFDPTGKSSTGVNLEKPAVLFLPGHGDPQLSRSWRWMPILQKGLPVVTVQWANRDPECRSYATMGVRETKDLDLVINKLQELGFTKLGLYGFSMGASTAVLHAGSRNSEKSKVHAVVADAAYSDFSQFLSEYAWNAHYLPSFVSRGVIQQFTKSVAERANIDLNEIRPIREASKIEQPSMFICPLQDMTTLCHHSKDLHESCSAKEKHIIEEDCGHTERRSTECLMKIAGFFERHLLA